MKKKPKPPQKPDDAEQSQRFIDLANELEAAGELNPTVGEVALDGLVRKAAAPKK
jgi:hypothetical protein